MGPKEAVLEEKREVKNLLIFSLGRKFLPFEVLESRSKPIRSENLTPTPIALKGRENSPPYT